MFSSSYEIVETLCLAGTAVAATTKQEEAIECMLEQLAHVMPYDSATVHGFLERYDLLGEFFVNIEVNHATLAGHSFHHEVKYAVENGIFGSIDANRGDPQNGWDTDQFPNSVEELTLALHEIYAAGGFGKGGFNFDTKLRRQSMSRTDLFHGPHDRRHRLLPRGTRWRCVQFRHRHVRGISSGFTGESSRH